MVPKSIFFLIIPKIYTYRIIFLVDAGFLRVLAYIMTSCYIPYTMFAVIKTGGKQYIAEPGKKLKIEKLEAPEGETVSFDEVLLVSKGRDVEIGAPLVKGAKVEAKVLKQARARKVIVFRYNAKTRYRKKKGHRQHLTEVEVEKIVAK